MKIPRWRAGTGFGAAAWSAAVLVGALAGCSGQSAQEEAEAKSGYTSGVAAAAAKGGGVDWQKDFEAAVRFAKQESKPVMIDFYATWCGPCKMMDRKTFTDPVVIEKSRSFVSIKVDGDRERNLMRRYRVSAYPTFIFLDSNLREVNRALGYRDATRMGKLMDRALEKVKRGKTGD